MTPIVTRAPARSVAPVRMRCKVGRGNILIAGRFASAIRNRRSVAISFRSPRNNGTRQSETLRRSIHRGRRSVERAQEFSWLDIPTPSTVLGLYFNNLRLHPPLGQRRAAVKPPMPPPTTRTLFTAIFLLAFQFRTGPRPPHRSSPNPVRRLHHEFELAALIVLRERPVDRVAGKPALRAQRQVARVYKTARFVDARSDRRIFQFRSFGRDKAQHHRFFAADGAADRICRAVGIEFEQVKSMPIRLNKASAIGSYPPDEIQLPDGPLPRQMCIPKVTLSGMPSVIALRMDAIVRTAISGRCPDFVAAGRISDRKA